MKAAYYPILLLIVGLGLSFVLVREHPLAPVISERNINLAMRQIAHELLRADGDTQSQIPRVKPYKEHEFILPLGTHINYDKLIEIGPSILAQYGITENYNLALLDCSSSDLLFGFDATALQTDGTPACTGRDQDRGCHNLSFSISTPSSNGPRPMLYIMGSLAFISLILKRFEGDTDQAEGVSTILANKVARPNSEAFGQKTTEPSETNSPLPKDQQQLSPNSHFSFSAQQITIKDQAQELTYREAKLLDFLVQNGNEVLDRDRIHAAVWGSEGIMVGRSLDVFISRLRKKLAADESVEIITVHGIGYRLKVPEV